MFNENGFFGSQGGDVPIDEMMNELNGWELDNINEFEFTDVEEFKTEAIGLIMSSNYLERLTTWREEIKQHVVFSDEFVNNDGETGVLYYDVIFNIVDRLKQLILDNYVLMAGVSFGKDSSALLVLMLIAYGELKNEGKRVKNDGVIIHTNTLIEQPEVSSLAIEQWNTLIETIAELQLPVQMRFGKPSFSSSFLGRVVSGRAMPTIAASSYRECSTDLKVTPGQKVIRDYIKEVNKTDPDAKPCLLLGVRDEEGEIRASSIAENGGQEDPLAVTWLDKTSQYVCYPIKDFTVSSVWEVLTCSGKSNQKAIPSMIDFDRTVTVYADSSGECVFLASDKKDKGQSSACGARHGCALCVVSGARDKSMEALLENPKYTYLKQLSRVRDYLYKTHYNWADRNIWGRTIDSFGFAKIKPEAYSLSKCKTILHALISADYIEQERASDYEYMISSGEIENTAHNRRLCKPQFQFVKPEDIISIEFLWALNQFSTRAFEALNLWHKVYSNRELETLEWIDDFEAYPKTAKQPQPMFVYVGKDWEEQGLNQGIRDHDLEMVSFDPSEQLIARIKKMKDGEDKVYFTSRLSESASITADQHIAEMLCKDSSLWIKSYTRQQLPLAGLLKLFRLGGISIAKGRAFTYHNMALRSQWYRGNGMYGNCSMEELAEKKDVLDANYGVKLLTKKEYIAKVAELHNIEFDDSEILNAIDGHDADELETFSHYQTDLFSDEDAVVTTKVRKLTQTKKPKQKTQTALGQLDMF